VQLCHGSDHAEAQAVAGSVSAFFRAIKSPEYSIALLFWDSGTSVTHGKFDFFTDMASLYDDVAILRGEFERVAHKITGCVKEELRIARDKL
jgi:hypothetical protein